MTETSGAEALRRFLDYEEDNGGGGDDTPVYDVVGYDLTYGDLREVLRERDAYAAADQQQRALIAQQADTIRRWHAAVQEPDAETAQVKADLRAARDMFRRPDEETRPHR